MGYIYCLGMNIERIKTASCVLPLLYMFSNKMHHLPVNAIYMCFIISKFLRFVQKQLTHALLTFKIVVQCMDQFIHSDIIVFIDTFFYCCDRICQIGGTCNVKSCCAVFCTALLDRFTTFHTSLGNHGCEDYRIAEHMNALHNVISGCDQFVMMQNLLF